ncbi:MAG: HsdR family type I site-specific deoxyribonuclease [Clostridia bacterium]
MHNEKYTSEYDVEKKFIDIITTNWYKFNKMSLYEEMLDNFRSKLNLLNKSILGNQPLTDNELKEILIFLENKSIFETSQILRTGKIDCLKRNGFTLYIKLVNLEDIEMNYFEVVHQINMVGSYAGRFDVTLLINGLPFVQIELKKPGVEINQAFNQVLRYKRDGNYKSLYKFLQIFVISNEEHTRYFANNDQGIMKSNCFVWTDKTNKPMNLLYEFEESFLFCPFLFKLVFNYMIDSATEKKLYVMRPYQIYAFDALKQKCLKEDKDGYCFHSTGSGKTLTSFKFAHDVSLNKDIDKVFFLVDRKDLDDKTVEDFNSYMSSTIDEFTNIKKTDTLIDDIKSNKKLIISTINKMSNALKGKRIDELKEYKNKKMVFMFDECHRSQAGDMRKVIQNYFSNALYYGFTGTPIFTEEDEITQNAKLTSLYFGKPVHTYTLKEAIGDKNVLPLCIDYVKTVKQKNETYFLDKEVQTINYTEALNNIRRCQLVAENIIQYFDQKTCGKKYNAIFACESIHLLNQYYDLLLNNKENIKIATIYSYDPNEESKEGDNLEIAKNKMAEIINEYNKRPENNSNFSLTTYLQYERDVINNFRNKNIDLLIVVDKCLTGMDFKRCNTLYLDKAMKMHGLIQAISRTIRTYDESKICGNIICYQTSRKVMDQALAHFNNDEDVYNDVTLEPLENLIEKLNNSFKLCKEQRKFANSKSEKDKLNFINAFRELMHVFNKINNYIEFDINKTEMDLKTYYEMQGLYKDIYNELKPNVTKESILNDIDFEISLLGRTKVNFDYLVELLLKYQQENLKNNKNKVKTKIHRLLLEINDKSKRELLERFVNSFMNENIEGLYNDPVKAYEDYINNEKDKELARISKKFNVNIEKLKELVENYSFFQDDVELNLDVTNLLGKNNELTIDDRLKILDKLPSEIKGFFDKFDEITVY